MARTPFFYSRRARKLTPQKPRGLRKNRRKSPFLALEKRFALKNGLGLKNLFFRPCGRKKIGAAQKLSKAQAGQIGKKTGKTPPCIALQLHAAFEVAGQGRADGSGVECSGLSVVLCVGVPLLVIPPLVSSVSW